MSLVPPHATNLHSESSFSSRTGGGGKCSRPPVLDGATFCRSRAPLCCPQISRGAVHCWSQTKVRKKGYGVQRPQMSRRCSCLETRASSSRIRALTCLYSQYTVSIGALSSFCTFLPVCFWKSSSNSRSSLRSRRFSSFDCCCC